MSKKREDVAADTSGRAKADPLRVSATQLAAIMNVSRTAVMKWVDEEGAPCESRGTRGLPVQIYLPRFMEWWTERVRRKAEAEGGSSQLSKRKEEIELARLELKYRQEVKEVMPRAVLVRVVRDVATRANQRLRQIPANEAFGFVGLSDKESAEAMLTAVLDGVASEFRRSEFWRSEFGAADLLGTFGEM